MPLASFVPGWRCAGAILSSAHQLSECCLVCFSQQIANCLAILEYPPRTLNSTHIATLECTLQSSERSQCYLLHQTLMIVWRLASELADSRRVLSVQK